MSGEHPWRILPSLVGYVATNGQTGRWCRTLTEAEQYVETEQWTESERNLEWGGIMHAMDTYTGLTFACRHNNHLDCPVTAECACWCHTEAS